MYAVLSACAVSLKALAVLCGVNRHAWAAADDGGCILAAAFVVRGHRVKRVFCKSLVIRVTRARSRVTRPGSSST